MRKVIRAFFGAFVLGQALALLVAAAATLWWSSDLMMLLISLVGPECALGPDNVHHIEGGGMLLTNPAAMIRWTTPFWFLGLVQITSAFTLVRLWWSHRPSGDNGSKISEKAPAAPSNRPTSPGPSAIEPQPDLDFENLKVLCIVQALAGAVTENVRAVTARCAPNSVAVTFVLYREDPEMREEIEDFIGELEALQLSGSIEISVRVIIDDQPMGEERKHWQDGRIILMRKELE